MLRDTRRIQGTVGARFWEKVAQDEGEGGCWRWTGAMSGSGQGVFTVGGSPCTAARAAWELTIGPVPVGVKLRRTCGTLTCIRPAHREMQIRGGAVEAIMRDSPKPLPPLVYPRVVRGHGGRPYIARGPEDEPT